MSADRTRIPLCEASNVPDGEPLRVVPAGMDAVAVCRLDGAYHAVDDLCSHGMASLSDGEIEDGTIICPFHGGSFDITTGAAVERPCTVDIRHYDVVEESGTLFLLV